MTFVVSKIMEHIITIELVWHMEWNIVLFTDQHLFRNIHSCEKQLIVLVLDITGNLDKGLQMETFSL